MSPSWAAPHFFPQVHDRAIQRLHDEFGLHPVEFATTRAPSSPAARAADLNAAFADPTITAVISTIGGDDQITVLRHLDMSVITTNPKRFLGYSDNTNLLNYLWFHGIAGVYGGSTQVHFGPVPDPEHLDSLRAALFGTDHVLVPPTRTRDVGLRWDDPDVLVTPAPDLPAEPWTWHCDTTAVTAPTWGGCLEIVEWTLATNQWMHSTEEYVGAILMLEISEDQPSPTEVGYLLRNLGERGILGGASAVLWARPPVSDHDHPSTATEAAAVREQYRDVVTTTIDTYAPGIPVVLDVDFGHTGPQLLLPYGGPVTVDGRTHTITAHFGE
ncbi:S66 peptidase family protein [Rudaeicoccus suwonensis]|uniref:S66 peptidase family protein n=1 Tax=Rudaeicoccus suwonensis TaxID=657409 RepID=UPI001FE567D6|nr:LD-carboxypeptidase [Rudaeicoccus suwonensis]